MHGKAMACAGYATTKKKKGSGAVRAPPGFGISCSMGSEGALASYADPEAGADAYSTLMLLQLVRLLKPAGKLFIMMTGVLRGWIGT